jgi:hypothetical protein
MRGEISGNAGFGGPSAAALAPMKAKFAVGRSRRAKSAPTCSAQTGPLVSRPSTTSGRGIGWPVIALTRPSRLPGSDRLSPKAKKAVKRSTVAAAAGEAPIRRATATAQADFSCMMTSYAGTVSTRLAAIPSTATAILG